MARAVIFANGLLSDMKVVGELIRLDDLLIAADGGARHALALGLVPTVLIGDLDSITDPDLRGLEAAGTRIHRYPRDKNETDLELAMHFAAEKGCDEILVIAALGGRLDQTLGNLSLLSGEEFAAIPIRLEDGLEETFFVRNCCQVQGDPGDLVSLLPWGGEVTGIVTTGLRWALTDETLYPDRTRGISNELIGEAATISLQTGLMLVVHRRNRRS
jgi:thiamine pyrophosphokinase